MRSLASADGGGGTARRAGGPASSAPAALPPSASAARTAPAQLAKRVARLRIEEVHLRDVDADGDLGLELQLDVRRELRDEVGARRDDALFADGLLLFLLLMLTLAHGGGVDVEVD